MTDTVYVVTTSYDSDFDTYIDGVFFDQENAKRYVKLLVSESTSDYEWEYHEDGSADNGYTFHIIEETKVKG